MSHALEKVGTFEIIIKQKHFSSDHMVKSLLEDQSTLTSFNSVNYADNASAQFGPPPQG